MTTTRRIEYLPLDEIQPAQRNPKRHAMAAITDSIDRFGYIEPVVLDERTGRLVSGHGRVESLTARFVAGVPAPDGVTVDDRGRWLLPVVRGWSSTSDREAEAFLVAANRLTEAGGWAADELAAILTDLRTDDALMGTGYTPGDVDALIKANLDHDTPPDLPRIVPLADRFMIPPFSVLNAREGWWQDRKRAWVQLGIRSEEGRSAPAYKAQDELDAIRAPKPTLAQGLYARRDPVTGDLRYEPLLDRHKDKGTGPFPGGGGGGAWIATDDDGTVGSGTSIFDPVLCEVAYRWFARPGARVLDPFAGGSVRGIVAAKLGMDYTGIDLSAVQVAANVDQAAAILGATDGTVRWVQGDSAAVLAGGHPDDPGDGFDLLFTCPPYADLEVYSDDPADISAMDYAEFLVAYRTILHRAAARLADNRFAVVVVGEARGHDRNGSYYGFVPDTIAAMRDAGLEYYNEAILVTAVGSLPLRIGRQFAAGRKIGKTHQNVLVFVKGDVKAAVEWCGVVDVTDTLPPVADS